ncbi:unnamed protein product [Clonostachys rosea f. rosea IK726]|uniref:Uncharacterized protein n=3 Tax=Bionectria ochroleuca TaxID=29856 RepID=A0A0B7K3H8_BIOOC|nr:unnamed protein product [Clonostachys rosea f. rosea IK726]CAG9949375.1 unnamed protein product [Clonostachys rosea f. rosea IK726]
MNLDAYLKFDHDRRERFQPFVTGRDERHPTQDSRGVFEFLDCLFLLNRANRRAASIYTAVDR